MNILYKPGDIVCVRDDLIEDELYDGVIVMHSMLKFAGKFVTIKNYADWGDGYNLVEDYRYVWTDAMFSGKICRETTEVEEPNELNELFM